jgi:hypothetical protein
MLTFPLYIRTAWNDFFPGAYTNTYNSKTYTSVQTLSGTGAYVSNCLFISITSTSNGGALLGNSVTYLLVESSSFFSCKTSSYAGAICFSNNGGQCVLHKVCGYGCCTTSYNNVQFAYILVNNAASSKNCVNYSSIARCVNEISGSWYSLEQHYGKVCCPSVNSSMNKCYGRAGIYCCPISDSNSFTCSLTYCSFVDNTATEYTCIHIGTSGAKYEIKSCNILRNTQGTLDSEGTIYTRGNLMIDDSCILQNIATYIFRQGSSSTITLSNCTVDSTSNNGYMTTKNTVTKNFILALNHMSTRNCHSEYDSAGTLIPIIHSPSSSKRQIVCYTGDKFFHHLQPRDFFSLIGILFFNFIHIYASGNHFY